MIAMGMWQMTTNPTSEEYTSVCRTLVQRYPILKDTHGNGFVSQNMLHAHMMQSILACANVKHFR